MRSNGGGAGIVSALVALCVSLAPVRAEAEPRVALVIGNANYGSFEKLGNPLNDAHLISDALQRVGFHVMEVHDASLNEMRKALDALDKAIGLDGPDTTALFYFAGKGALIDGRNCLLPVDFSGKGPLLPGDQTTDVDEILATLKQAGARTKLVFVDTSRLPLFESGTHVTATFTPAEQEDGVVVGYSTAPGAVAADGEGKNSPYASALAKAIGTPLKTIEEALRAVRIDVMKATGSKQIPWDAESLREPFFFVSN